MYFKDSNRTLDPLAEGTLKQQDVTFLLYADDLVILAETEKEISLFLQTMREKFHDHQMAMNISKAEVMGFFAGEGSITTRRKWHKPFIDMQKEK